MSAGGKLDTRRRKDYWNGCPSPPAAFSRGGSTGSRRQNSDTVEALRRRSHGPRGITTTTLSIHPLASFVQMACEGKQQHCGSRGEGEGEGRRGEGQERDRCRKAVRDSAGTLPGAEVEEGAHWISACRGARGYDQASAAMEGTQDLARRARGRCDQSQDHTARVLRSASCSGATGTHTPMDTSDGVTGGRSGLESVLTRGG